MQSTPVLFRVCKTRISLNQLNNFILASNGGRFTQCTQWTEVFNQGPRQRPQLYCELRGEVQRRLVVQELYAEQSEWLVPSRKPPHPRGGHQLASLAGPPVFCSESRDEHDEPRPPHSCFAKQNLRRKIFTGVGLTKERSVMKYLNHFTSLAC